MLLRWLDICIETDGCAHKFIIVDKFYARRYSRHFPSHLNCCCPDLRVSIILVGNQVAAEGGIP